MSIARKILENTFIQVVGKLITAGLSIIVLKIISGYLGTAGYGDYTTVYQFLALFGIIADFGIYTITIKEMSKDQSQIPRILGNVLGLRSALAVFAMILAVIAAFLMPAYGDTLIPLGVVVATFATFFTLLNGTVSTVLQVHLKMQYATISLVIGKIASVAYMAWVAFFLYPDNAVLGFYHLLWAGVIGNLIMFVVTAYYTRRYTKITYCFDYDFWRKIFLTSLPYGVALVLNTLYFRLDVILMTLLLPHSTTLGEGECAQRLCGDTEVGLYGVAQRMLEMLVIIPVYFMNSVLPIMTRYLEEKNQKIKQLVQYSFDFLIASGVPILVGGFILAVPFIHFISDVTYLSGNTFTYGSDVAIKILMFAMLFSFVNSLFGFTLVVLNQQIKLMYINAGGVLFNLIGNLLVIPHWGFRGAALTSVFSEFLILIFTYWMAQKVLQFHISLITLLKTVFSATMMGLFIFIGFMWMKNVWFVWQLAILIPLGGVVYMFFMLKTKAVTSEMLALLKKK
ncbi:hypothetical protein COY07_03365 [Candidatus Peregrinibacteria bacterium CG_4_10_14_0_2_um_filter_43_11]|nr:MAG: hypothetical protein COY07_03365 [Candidatus Peregrinibacteria bacterium CG_4_10_14_0_2_um_filter_43_11]